MFLPSLLVLAPLFQQGSAPSIEWVVKESLIPLPSLENDEKFTWWGRYPFSDLGGDGITDTMLTGLWSPEPYTGISGTNFLGLVTDDSGMSGRPTRSITYEGGHVWAYLQTPTERRLIANARYPGSIAQYPVAISLTSGEIIGRIHFPTNLGPGIPDPEYISWMSPAGDTDGDGYDDFFWVDWRNTAGGFAYFGLFDGKTLTSRWTVAEPAGAGFPSISWEPSPMPDLTGDGIADFLVGTVTYTGYHQGDHSWFLLSGADGLTVWRENAPELNTGGAIIGRDMNADGDPDAILWQFDALRSISAKDGQEIWRTPWSVLEATLPPGVQLQNSIQGEMTFSSGLLASDHMVVLDPYDTDSGNTQTTSLGFAHFDAADGSLLGTSALSTDLSPWGNGNLTWGYGIGTPYGDYDRDGFMEYSILANDPDHTPVWAKQGSNPSYSQRLMIVGQRTLFTPDTHDVMSAGPVTFDILCPTGSGKDFVVLLSTAFSEEQGLSFGRWKTYLGDSRILDLSLSSRFLSGTLDSEGQGSTFAVVPPNPALIGQALYSRGIIFNPPGSAEAIWTITSLSTTELQ